MQAFKDMVCNRLCVDYMHSVDIEPDERRQYKANGRPTKMRTKETQSKYIVSSRSKP